MILRPTKIEDISRVIDIINQAKTYFKNNDIDIHQILEVIRDAQKSMCDNGIDQWQDGYPNEETIEKDIENNEAYVLEEDGVILGTCMVTIHGEPAYNRIEGLASTILDQVVAMYPDYHSVRMDTHHDNLSMQSFLTKYGFKYCGEITLKSGALRRAYEKRI